MPVFASQQSKLKMVILTKHSIENQVWWSPINQNRWSNERIISGMLRRFKRSYLYGLTNRIQFYHNNILIDQYKL